MRKIARSFLGLSLTAFIIALAANAETAISAREPLNQVPSPPANSETNRLKQSKSVPEYEESILVENQTFFGIGLAGDGSVYGTDYVEATLVKYDSKTKQTSKVLQNLKGPLKIAIRENLVYFTETGTEDKKYKDGRLSVYNIDSGRVQVLLENLDYPNGLYVATAGDIYYTEAGASSTSFGGVDRLSVLRKGMSKPTVISEEIDAPTDVVVDSAGNIFVSKMGRSSPGDTGELWKLSPDGSSPQLLLKGLASPTDLDIDKEGNIYIAGLGEEKGNFTAVALVPKKQPYEAIALKEGLFAFSVAVADSGDVYYSTGRTLDSVRILRKKQ